MDSLRGRRGAAPRGRACRRALYFQFNQVRDDSDETIADFAKRLHERLAAGEIDHLIVDVRHNNGGNNGLVRPLVRTLVAFDVADPEHRIFIATGRNTFSAAQNFVNRVEQWVDVELVGEPSSPSPNFVGDRRASIPPDHPVNLQIADYVRGHDPALALIFDVLPAAESEAAAADR